MTRLARVVVPGEAHHITQRGNRRHPVFFSEEDYRAYIAAMAQSCARFGVAIWAWCLMPNHVHLIAVPQTVASLTQAIAQAHQRYTSRINQRENWRGHLWQGRFGSFVLDPAHLWTAARYVELNPVRAQLAAHPAHWPWSSARAHLSGEDDALAQVAPLLERFGDWSSYLSAALTVEELERFRRHARTGRPLGDAAFLQRLEAQLSRPLQKRKPGRKPRGKDEEAPG
jgi:putative transposase